MLTPDTTRAFLIIESVDPTRKKAFQEATEQLADWVHRYTGAEVEITFLHQTNREMEL
jgi:DNA/RNA-binding domain of Phe-tRNA-synthetase-like protein